MKARVVSGIKIEKLSDDEIKKRGVARWPVWEKEISTFDWTYDGAEQCYFLEGKVRVRADEGVVEIGPGDFVTFPSGLSCVWEVREPVRKHYKI